MRDTEWGLTTLWLKPVWECPPPVIARMTKLHNLQIPQRENDTRTGAVFCFTANYFHSMEKHTEVQIGGVPLLMPNKIQWLVGMKCRDALFNEHHLTVVRTNWSISDALTSFLSWYGKPWVSLSLRDRCTDTISQRSSPFFCVWCLQFAQLTRILNMHPLASSKSSS